MLVNSSPLLSSLTTYSVSETSVFTQVDLSIIKHRRWTFRTMNGSMLHVIEMFCSFFCAMSCFIQLFWQVKDPLYTHNLEPTARSQVLTTGGQVRLGATGVVCFYTYLNEEQDTFSLETCIRVLSLKVVLFLYLLPFFLAVVFLFDLFQRGFPAFSRTKSFALLSWLIFSRICTWETTGIEKLITAIK